MSKFANYALPLRKNSLGLIIGIILLFAAAMISGKIHGFSFSAWEELLSKKESGSSLIYGKPQFDRTDDYAVSLALMLAQTTHKPPFPVVNTNIAAGQNMLLIANMPVFHPLIIFRPQTWGFFLSGDIGLAWLWNFKIAGLLISILYLSYLLSNRNILISAIAALGFLYSPFLQYWSLNCAEFFIWGSALAFSSFSLLFSTSRKQTGVWALLFCWSLGCFVHLLYPTYQIFTGYSAICVLISLILINKKKWLEIKSFFLLKVAAVIFSLLITILSVYLLFRDSKDVFELLTHAIYPASQVSLGGGIRPLKIFANYFPIYLIPNLFGNICEGASFVMIVPPVLIYLLFLAFRGNRRPLLIASPLIVFFCILVAWTTLGFPEWIAKLTLFSKAPPHRSIAGFGLINIATLIIAATSESPRNSKISSIPKLLLGVSIIVWIGFLYRLGLEVRAENIPNRLVIIAIFFQLIFLLFLLIGQRVLALILWASLSAYYSYGFNPIARGGYEILRKDALAQAMQKIDQAWSNQSYWITTDDWILPNLPRMLGIHALNGNFYYPQMDLLKKLDPKRSFEQTYNRYAHVVIHFRENSDRYFGSHIFDSFELIFKPQDPMLKELGITHILATENETIELLKRARYPLLYSSNPNFAVFAVKGDPSSLDPRDQEFIKNSNYD